MGDDEEDKENIKITMTNANETDSEPSNKSTKTKSENNSINGSKDIINQIKQIKENSSQIKDDFIKRNEYDHNHYNNKLKMNLKHEIEFKNHLQKKLNKLDNRLNILQMKYNTYKRWYDRFNILIIIISSILSVFEAFRNEIHDNIDENNESLKIMFNMIPIGISSTITCSAAIVKFKKYQEKMEYMQFTREKVILAISKLKLVQESLWFNKDEEFDEIKQKYLHDVYLIYNESNSELERHIKYDDHTKFFEMNQKKRKVKKEKKNELLSIV
jgi:hypothetical protein